MPIVRRAERQAGIGTMPGVRKTAAETAASEGAGVEQARGEKFSAVAGFGERAVRLGASMFHRAQEEERQSANQTALLKANNQLAEWKNDRLFNPETGAFTKKGESANTLPEELRADFDKLAGEIEAGLATDEQRAAFSKLRSEEWQSVDLQVRRHVFQEIQQFKQGELESLVANATNAAVLSATDPKLVAVELNKAVTAIRTNGPSLGHGPETIEKHVRAVQSSTHVGVISKLLAEGKERQASAYFDATKGQIDGAAVDQVTKALDEGSLRAESQKEADRIIASGKTLTEQRAMAREIDDAKLRDQVEQRIEHNNAIAEREERERDEATMRQGYDILDKTADIRSIPPSLWASYSGATRSAMTSYADRRAKGKPVETDLPTYYSLIKKAGDDPAGFATENLLAYRGRLDDAEFKQLAGLQLSLKNGDRKAADKDLAPFQTRGQLIDDTLTLHGIDPNAKPDTPEGKAIAQLRRMVDRRVEFLQGAGQKASNQDIQGEIDALLSQRVTVPGSWWNIFPGGKSVADTEKRLLDLEPADIPPAERRQIEEALRARNRPVSDATVLDLYLETKVRNRK